MLFKQSGLPFTHAANGAFNSDITWVHRHKDDGDKTITLRKLTLSISLLAASLILAASAQAETWTCAFINPNTQKPEKLAIVRDGGTFIEQFNKTPYRIMKETKNTIQLFFVGDVYPDMPLILMIWKKSGQFTQILPGAGRNLEIFGSCKTGL